MIYPEINPVAFELGPLKVHWYGLTYLLGFAGAWLFARSRSKKPWSPVKANQVEDLIIYIAFGVIIGGRLGSGLFYNFDQWMQEPWWIFKIWEGGMAFHGGLIGVIIALWRFSRRIDKPFLAVTDFIVPAVPIGLAFGRLGNFIGGELWGRETTGWWGMVFPHVDDKTRHPSQLYEMFLEGIVLFAFLFWFSRKPRPAGAIGGFFLLFYGVFRFVVEFVREPDSHLAEDLLFGWMTRGQLLCLPMIAIGIGFVVWAFSKRPKNTTVKESKA